MKVLVATHKKQGKRKNDFCWATDGELVRLGMVCDSDHGPDGPCGCKRSLPGFDSHKSTTTVEVVDRDLTPEQFHQQLAKSFSDSGWGLSDDDVKADADELLRLAACFPVGCVVEIRGKSIKERL